MATDMLYGFFRDISKFKDIHNTKRIVFCFDYKPLLRNEIYPTYKDRKPQTEEYKLSVEYEKIQVLRKQIVKLRNRILKEAGFKNILSQKGYEADDIIASVCQNLAAKDEAIIIGSDNDLLQLLSPQVIMWNPMNGEATTAESFEHRIGIPPYKWGKAKAIAGCPTDKVAGIEGVGNITAVRYLRKELQKSSKAYKAIILGKDIIERNMRLVKLPFEGTKVFKLKDDRESHEKWNAIIRRFDMLSLKDKI